MAGGGGGEAGGCYRGEFYLMCHQNGVSKNTVSLGRGEQLAKMQRFCYGFSHCLILGGGMALSRGV